MRRRTLLAGGSAALLATPAIAQDQRANTLRVVPRSGLGSLDPVQTTIDVVGAHGSYIFDTLYAAGPELQPRPQMAAGHEPAALVSCPVALRPAARQGRRDVGRPRRSHDRTQTIAAVPAAAGGDQNVDLQRVDLGTLTRRRASREPIEKGGWSLFITAPSGTLANPALSLFVQGNGDSGFVGWWSNQHAQDLVEAWVRKPDAAARRRTALELGHLAMTDAGTIPLGKFVERTAFRRTITGIIPGPCPYPWNVRPT